MTSDEPVEQPADEETTRFVARALGSGDVIGHFRVVRLLGEGGSGAIYEAHNIHNEDERVALKILQPDIPDRERFFELMRAEANAMQRLKNEAVVQYRTFGRIPESDEFYLVIEYVEGPTLGKAMRARPLDEPALRRLALRLLEGLAAAHEQGVIHRDLSPDNVVLPGGDPDRATLIDFGIARNGAFDPLGGIGFAGKLSYAAPEQLAGGTIGPWTDLYTLGLVLAAAARGEKLPMGKDIASATALREAVPHLDGVPPGLHAPLAALLQPDPERRVRSAAEAEVLFRPQPQAAPPAPPRSRRTLWIGIAAAIVIAGGAAAALLLTGKPGGQTATAPPPAASSAPPAPAPKPEPQPEAKPEPKVEPPAPPAAPLKPAEVLLSERLTETVAQAKDAADRAVTAAEEGEAAAGRAAEAAGKAGAAATRAGEAADKARAAAEAACSETPPPNHDCGDDEAGNHYAGEATCAAEVCEADDYGSGKFAGDEAVYDGAWRGADFTLGCATRNGVETQCGEWKGQLLNGYAVSVGDDRLVVAGAFKGGLLTGPAELNFNDVPSEPEAAIDGDDVATGEIVGHGAVLWKSGDRSVGLWRTGRQLEAGVVATVSGLRTEAVYAEGAPPTGRVVYKDGRVYLGEFIDDGRTVRRSGLGVLYDAKGKIAGQGRWQDDALVADFGAPP